MKQIYEWQRGEISKVTKNGETIMIGRSDNVGVANVAEILNAETAPLLARIAELEAALEMNLDASSDIAEDESIDAMRGRLQSIRAKSVHALKKAGDHD